MTLRHIPLLLAMLFGTSIALAANPQKPAVSDITAGLLSIKIDGMQDLPISGLKMVKSGEQTLFISSNGRFAFYGGKLMDIWTQQEIKELADIDKIANRIDLSRMKLKSDDLGAVTVGHGKAQVLVFIDPRCPYCGKVMKELQSLQDQYTFKLVMVPILGPESQNLVVQLACQLGASDTKAKDAVRDRLLKQDYAGLPTEPPAQCNKEPLQKAVVTAKLFDLKGVPFLIAPDGRTHSGAPEVLADWLADKPKRSPSLATTPDTNAQNTNATEKKP
ncbi:DsbC family protein [Methylomonas sp. LW13]|uniref:DsbC family protein n=1 Tax=unclassified Methylomonas TaxID=2608980 RepID=UPI000AFB8335|nr:DsbC family protein [Methylomonas sp. LW13]QBC27773.1 DsbC family protein [Methylomonas sp. LW13]QBC28113.1 DsbC family protein [Methylomonas sp. LW13]